ncbi:hypothetical protein DTO169E5_5567 [Paecilomyces variotii]|nr:hypothetical protein DTO169E5_5567 [Paecilomyces variotii]
MLGADALNLTLGRLVYSRFAEFLPLLGAFLIANNDITKPIPGFVAYNITDGIMATDVTGWFSRWLLCQEFKSCSIILCISIRATGRLTLRHAASFIIGITCMTPIIVLPIVMGDWWGFVNALSMLLSILVRKVIMDQNRHAISTAARQAFDTSKDVVKTFWTLPTGTVITIYTPRRILTDVLLTNPRPHRLRLYNAARALGWVAFGCHVISLGMTTLFNQIISVALLLLATVMVVYRFGEREYLIGNDIVICRCDAKGERFRAATYARLDLSGKEEESMVLWNLFPHKTNTEWWSKYRDCVRQGNSGFTSWDEKLAGYYDEKVV